MLSNGYTLYLLTFARIVFRTPPGPLRYLSGSVGVLFKVRLSSYGYTLVAKSVEEPHLACLQRDFFGYEICKNTAVRHPLGNILISSRIALQGVQLGRPPDNDQGTGLSIHDATTSVFYRRIRITDFHSTKYEE